MEATNFELVDSYSIKLWVKLGHSKNLLNFPFRKGGDLGGKEEVTGGRRSCPSTDLSFLNLTIFFAART